MSRDGFDEILGEAPEEYGEDLQTGEGLLDSDPDEYLSNEIGLIGPESDFEDSYDTSTREGREKLAKDIHTAVKGDTFLATEIMLQAGYTADREEVQDDVEQKAYELAMEAGATERPLPGRTVRNRVREASDQVEVSDSLLDRDLYTVDDLDIGDDTGFDTDF